MNKQEFLIKQNQLEKQLFLERYNLTDVMFDTNSDLKMMLLSNLSDIQETGDISKVDNLKRFIIDFFETQKRHQELNWK
jgi:hypothetical protein